MAANTWRAKGRKNKVSQKETARKIDVLLALPALVSEGGERMSLVRRHTGALCPWDDKYQYGKHRGMEMGGMGKG